MMTILMVTARQVDVSACKATNTNKEIITERQTLVQCEYV